MKRQNGIFRHAKFQTISIFLGIVTLVFIGCGGGGGSSGGDSKDTQKEITLSGSQFVPGQFLTISHPTITAGSDSVVQLKGADGYSVDLQSSLTEDGSVQVVIPPYINPQTGEFISGEISISVQGIELEKSITISELPEIESVDPGSALKALLEEEIIILQEIRSQLEISSENLDNTDISTATDAIDEYIAVINQMISEMETEGTLTVPVADGGDIVLNSDELLTADRLIVALLEGLLEEFSISPSQMRSLIDSQAEGDGTSIDQWVKNAVKDIKDKTKRAITAKTLLTAGLSIGLTVIGLAASPAVGAVAGTAGLMVTVYVSMTSVAVGTVSEAAAQSLNINNREQYNASKEIIDEGISVTKAVSENLPGGVGQAVTAYNTFETFRSMSEILKNAKCEEYQSPNPQNSYTRNTVKYFCTGIPEDTLSFPAVYRGKGTYIFTWVHYNWVEINHECNLGETEFRAELTENGLFDVNFVDNVHASIDFNGTQYENERTNTTFGVNCEFVEPDPFDYWDDAFWGTYADGELELNQYTDGVFSGTYSADKLSGEGYRVVRGGGDNHIIDKFYFKFENLERQ